MIHHKAEVSTSFRERSSMALKLINLNNVLVEFPVNL